MTADRAEVVHLAVAIGWLRTVAHYVGWYLTRCGRHSAARGPETGTAPQAGVDETR